MTRLRAALLLELTVEWRYRIPTVALIVTAVWTGVLLAMPASLARGLGPVILTIDTATFGSFFIAALVLFERGEGALAALTVSPLRLREYLGAKVVALAGLSVLSAVPIALAARADLVMALVGVAMLSVLFLVLNFALAVRHRTLTGFLTVAPLPLAPLIAAPLAHLTCDGWAVGSASADEPLDRPRRHRGRGWCAGVVQRRWAARSASAMARKPPMSRTVGTRPAIGPSRSRVKVDTSYAPVGSTCETREDGVNDRVACPRSWVCPVRAGTARLGPVCREVWSASHLRPEVGFVVDLWSTGWNWFSARATASGTS